MKKVLEQDPHNRNHSDVELPLPSPEAADQRAIGIRTPSPANAAPLHSSGSQINSKDASHRRITPYSWNLGHDLS